MAFYPKTNRGQRAKLTTDKGEVVTMIFENKPQGTYGRQFMIMFTGAMNDLAADKTAPMPMFKVLLWAMANLDHQKWRQIKQIDIAETIGVTHPTVSRGLHALLERGIIERQGSGPRQEWRLTTEASWKGTVGSYQKARREKLEVGSDLTLSDKAKVIMFKRRQLEDEQQELQDDLEDLPDGSA